MDGIDYLTNIVPNMLDFRWFQLAGINDIRNAGMFQFAVYSAPEDLITIPALGSYITNLIMKPGTIIYGLLALELSETIDTGSIDVNHFTLKAYLEPGGPIIEQYVRSSFGRDYTYTGKSLTGNDVCERQGLPYTILDKPVQVLDSRIRVEISNPSIDTAINPIVSLICAEPVASLGDRSGRYC